MSSVPPDSDPDHRLSLTEQGYAIRTWRYLRLAMVGLVAGLAVAIGYERWKSSDGCWQTSISAYYYTPVHALLIGVLVALGVCLCCLRGNLEVEEVLLNLAGMLTPVIAFVPVDRPNGCVSDSPMLDRYSDIANNMLALVVLETLAAALAGTLWLRGRGRSVGGASPVVRWGYLVAAVVVAAEWVLWILFTHDHRGAFSSATHFTAATAMFACFFLVVVVDSIAIEPGHGFWWHVRNPNRYTVIAMLMVLSTLAFVVLEFAVRWAYAVFQIESCLITLFVVFWVAQTVESWRADLPRRTVPRFLEAVSRSRERVSARRRP